MHEVREVPAANQFPVWTSTAILRATSQSGTVQTALIAGCVTRDDREGRRPSTVIWGCSKPFGQGLSPCPRIDHPTEIKVVIG